MRMKLKHWARYWWQSLRSETPEFKYVKHIVWGRNLNHKDTKIPKKIWIYWHSNPIDSSTVSICIKEIIRLNPEYKVEVIHQESVLSFIPDFPVSVFEKPPIFASDLIRLFLLERHGGFYLDGSTLLSEGLDWALNCVAADNSEAILYYTDENTLDSHFPMVENSFIGAIPGSKFITEWRQLYQECITSVEPEKYFENNEVLPLSQFPLNTNYYLAYISGQIIMRKNQNFRLTLLRAEDDSFLYSLKIKKKWGEVEMAEILLLNKTPDPKPKTVKLIRYARRRLDFYIKRGMYKEGSWMGDLILKMQSK